MFKLLRKLLLIPVVLLIGLVFYYFVGNPDRRRTLVQQAQEIHESVNGQKKYAWTGTAVVLEVTKGDRMTIDTESSHKVVIRLAGVDAPEFSPDHIHKDQPLAKESKERLAELLKGKAVQMAIVEPDPEKHPLALLTLDGTLINAQIVGEGLAEAAPETSSAIPAKPWHEIQNAELQARQRHLGIWTLTNYVRPVEYRIRQRTAVYGRYGTD
jgi:endonuclease YncB( thermonuclease family)